MGKLSNSEKIEIMRIIKTAGIPCDSKEEFLKWVALIEDDQTPLKGDEGDQPKSE